MFARRHTWRLFESVSRRSQPQELVSSNGATFKLSNLKLSQSLMTTLILMMTISLGADEPSAEQLKLLQVFHQEFVELTPGAGKFPSSLVMGADDGPSNARPAHRVTFDYAFAVAKYEVPQNLWQAVVGENPSRWKGPRNSVEMLTHSEAIAFCEKATRLMRAAKMIPKGREVRLPTEAEWEYFARAGTDTVYSFGDAVKELDKHAWHTGNAAGNDPPVGALAPNPWGLYDVHGYLSEWCLDVPSENYKSTPKDGSAHNPTAGGANRIVRGGSWKDKAPTLASRARTSLKANTRDDAVGLRCVLAPVKSAPRKAAKRSE